MRTRQPFAKEPGRKQSTIISLIAHVFIIALIGSITFSYPIAAFFNVKTDIPEEHVHYVPLRRSPPPKLGNGTEGKAAPHAVKVVPPAPIVAPITVPTQLPPVPATASSTGSATGTPGGTGGSPNGVVGGMAPALPDARIDLRPDTRRLPLSIGQRNDSAVKAIFLAYREAELQAEANQGKSPRDWTFMHGDQKYGVDSQYIYLGKFKIPSAVLAALPLNFGGVDGTRLIENRNADWIRNDIYTHSQGMTEDDFNAAVKRIHERKLREKKEDDDAKAKDGKDTKASPIVPTGGERD